MQVSYIHSYPNHFHFLIAMTSIESECHAVGITIISSFVRKHNSKEICRDITLYHANQCSLSSTCWVKGKSPVESKSSSRNWKKFLQWAKFSCRVRTFSTFHVLLSQVELESHNGNQKFQASTIHWYITSLRGLSGRNRIVAPTYI